MNATSRITGLALAASCAGGLVPAGPAAAAPADDAQLIIEAPQATFLGYDPAGPVAAKILVTNRSAATARGVTVRLEIVDARGIAFTVDALRGCVVSRTVATCRLGDVDADETVAVDLRWTMLTRHYDEAANAVVIAKAGNAAVATAQTGALAGTDGGIGTGGPDADVRVTVPKRLTVTAGAPTSLPVVLRADGDAAVEGIFIRFGYGREQGVLTVTGPRGSTCVNRPAAAAPGLPQRTEVVCYLPERLVGGATSTTWGTQNPFRLTAAPGSARSAPYDLSVLVSPANANHRNVGRVPGGGWVIPPTVPMTTTVTGGDHNTPAGDMAITVTAPLVAVGSGAGGLPVTGPPTAWLVAGGLLALLAGLGAVTVSRRRRIVTTMN